GQYNLVWYISVLAYYNRSSIFLADKDPPLVDIYNSDPINLEIFEEGIAKYEGFFLPNNPDNPNPLPWQVFLKGDPSNPDWVKALFGDDLNNNPGGGGGGGGSGGGTMPIVTVAEVVDVVEGNPGDHYHAIVDVFLSKASPVPVKVDWTTAFGGLPGFATADPNVDYVDTSGTLTIDPGFTDGYISVEIIGDKIHEPTEMFLVAVVDADGALISADQSTARILILDDDPPAPPPKPPYRPGPGQPSRTVNSFDPNDKLA